MLAGTGAAVTGLGDGPAENNIATALAAPPAFDLERLVFGPDLVNVVRAGIHSSAIESLCVLLGQPMSVVLATVGVSERTWARRRTSVLTPAESDHVVRIVRLMDRATGVLGELGAARRWLDTPARAFGGQTPLAMAASETGASLVFDLLGRIEHGVFS